MALAVPKNLIKNVAVAGTRETLISSLTPAPESVLAINVVIQAKAGNVGVIYVGDSEVSSSKYGCRLTAGNSVSIEMPSIGNNAMEMDLKDLYIDAATSADGVSVFYFVRG